MDGAGIRSRLNTPYVFGEYVDLSGITCEDRLNLDGLSVAGVDLSGASFPCGISARGTQFLGVSWFRAISATDADLTGAVFHADARLDRAAIDGGLIMRDAEFRGVLQFDGAELAGDVDLHGAVGYGNCSFERASLGGCVDFRNSEWMGGLWLESASFAQLEADEMLIHGRLWTRRARLAQGRLSPDRFSISFGYSDA
ncbi:pentapeptide repeat-containing protein [Paracoccus sp. (in: a-proteobacteria)]|uniref:pentapeptide repeat-containing protein n=1 Tax=Paracoccus sp. TaxID=267 RepID=UPI003A857626